LENFQERTDGGIDSDLFAALRPGLLTHFRISPIKFVAVSLFVAFVELKADFQLSPYGHVKSLELSNRAPRSSLLMYSWERSSVPMMRHSIGLVSQSAGRQAAARRCLAYSVRSFWWRA